MNEGRKIGIDNILRVQLDKFKKDFSFIINGKIYKTNSYVANILSPNISKMYAKNMKQRYYEIDTEYNGDFNRIIEYGEMKMVHIDDNEKPFFLNILKQLGNHDEYFLYNKEFQEKISYDNVIERIQIKKALDMNFDEEVDFISSNFHDFNTKYIDKMFTLDVNSVERIISNDKLNLHDEEELFNFILKLYTKSKKYSILFSYVIFMNLSTESIQKFHQNFDINDINDSIWKNIFCRLEQNISFESKMAYKELHQEFLNYRYGKRYDHIIQHLNEQCHGNVHSQNIIHISSSSVGNGDYKVENIIESDNENDFGTKDQTNSWIQFDFKETKVLVDCYTLKTFNGFKNCAHLKNWIIEVSNDGQTYHEIDRHENCDLLNGNLKVVSFTVSYSTPQRFIRLRQIGRNWLDNDCLFINQIEFSGFLYE